MEVLVLEIDGYYINLRNVLFVYCEEKGQTKITFVDGQTITVRQDYRIVKMAIRKFNFGC